MRVITSLVITLIAVVATAAPKQSFTGTITDSMCPKADHSQMRMGPSDAACTLACVDAHGAAYVLYDGTNTYELSDQRTPQKFAGQKVKVVGTLDTNTKLIQVESITDKNLDSLAAAYMAVFAIFFVYLFTVARRVARLQDEITRITNA